ncbi:rod-binding protein [bacterium]|nr:rod-binding protein [bacterium]
MKSLESTGTSFQQLSSLKTKLRRPGSLPQAPGNDALKEAAQDFEALFLRQLLASMRRTVPEGDPDMKGPGMEIYENMLDAEFAKHISQSGRGLGLADMLMKQFEKAGVSHEK